MPPTFLTKFLRFRLLKILRYFQLFQLFNIATAVTCSLLLAHIFFNQLSLVASYALSDPLRPLSTSDFHSRYRKHRCRQILTSGEEILASVPAPGTPHLFLHHLSPLATAGYAASYWLMEYNMVCAMRWITHGQWEHCFSFFFCGMLFWYRCNSDPCFDG